MRWDGSCCGARISTDQRGSYFRQFWDVSGIISPSTPDGTLTRPKKRSSKILLHCTPGRRTICSANTITGNRKRRTTSDWSTIRGNLLKKYPNALGPRPKKPSRLLKATRTATTERKLNANFPKPFSRKRSSSRSTKPKLRPTLSFLDSESYRKTRNTEPT